MALWTPPISDPHRLPLVHTNVGWHSLAYPFGQEAERAIDQFLKDPLNGVQLNDLGATAVVRRQEAASSLLLDRFTIKQPVPLHDFQAAAEDAYLTARRHGRDRGLIVIPTGGGKTTTFTHIVGRIFQEQQQLQNGWRAACQARLLSSTAAFLEKWQAPARILVIVHTEEILDQNVAALVQVLGSEAHVGKVQTSRFQQWDRPVVVVSIQTLIAMDPRERQEWLRQFGQVVLDEAHHYVFGNDWFVPLIEMGFFDSEGNITWNWPKGMLGVTATTDRYTGLPLRTTFGPDGIVYSIDMAPLIEKRVLIEPYGIEVRVKTSNAHNPIRALKELSPEEKADLVLAIFKNRLYQEGRYLRTRVFVDNTDDLTAIVECLNTAKIQAIGVTKDQVYGTSLDRKSAMEGYGSGQFDALVTIRVGMEGHNDPGTEAGILVLSSDSRGGIIQRIGRLLRQDPLHPERRVAIIVDCGLNLERHDLGIPAREAYDLDDGSLIVRSSENGGLTRTPGTGLIDTVEIEDRGDLLNARPYPYFAQALRQFLPTPEEVERLAFAIDSNSDRLFQYWNGLALPGSLQEVEALARLIQDPWGMIVDAWAWEKVQEREQSFPLRADLSEEERSLAQWFRFGVFRWFGGSMEMALDTSQRTLTALWHDGSVPLHNQPRMPLTLLYDRITEIVSGPRPDLREIISALIPEVIRVKWQWRQESTTLPIAWVWLLGLAREAFITRFRGEPLMSGPEAVEQQDPIRSFAYDETVPEGSRSMQPLCESLLVLLAGDDPAARERVNLLLDEAIRESQELQGPFQEVAPKMAVFHAWALQGMIRRQRGFVPSKDQGKNIPYYMRELILSFYREGRFPESMGVKGLATFSSLVLEFSSAGNSQSLAEGRQRLQDALAESYGWDQPSGLSPAVDWLLTLFRFESMQRYQGSWPTTGPAGLGSRSWIRRFLEQGEEIPIQECFAELLSVLSNGDRVREQEWSEVLRLAAVAQATEKYRRQLGLEQELPQLAAPIQGLRWWLQHQLLDHPERSVLLQPSHVAFLQGGKIPPMFYGTYTRYQFYEDMLQAAAGDDLAVRETGNSLVRGALKELLGWTEDYRQSLPDAVERVLDRCLDIVCDKYRGLVPANAADIPRGSALSKFIDSRQWPQFRGTNEKMAVENFQDSLRNFFVTNGVPEAEADRLIGEVSVTA